MRTWFVGLLLLVAACGDSQSECDDPCCDLKLKGSPLACVDYNPDDDLVLKCTPVVPRFCCETCPDGETRCASNCVGDLPPGWQPPPTREEICEAACDTETEVCGDLRSAVPMPDCVTSCRANYPDAFDCQVWARHCVSRCGEGNDLQFIDGCALEGEAYLSCLTGCLMAYNGKVDNARDYTTEDCQ